MKRSLAQDIPTLRVPATVTAMVRVLVQRAVIQSPTTNLRAQVMLEVYYI